LGFAATTTSFTGVARARVFPGDAGGSITDFCPLDSAADLGFNDATLDFGFNDTTLDFGFSETALDFGFRDAALDFGFKLPRLDFDLAVLTTMRALAGGSGETECETKGGARTSGLLVLGVLNAARGFGFVARGLRLGFGGEEGAAEVEGEASSTSILSASTSASSDSSDSSFAGWGWG
jgi:hypothetical protein